ncbi:hypothetical protein J4234_05800 [Candidatus Woesearchaeota archaeon]|nr:hypothetical protein [Candidatus Woesearchaeota archaeon]
MKKGVLLFLIAFLIVPFPFAFADITITTDQSIYNLGNKIKASASILQDNTFEGLFELTISCDNYKLQYFLTPISLEANFRTAVNVPELAATSSMLGNCIIAGDLATNDNLVIEQEDSNKFGVTSQLTVLPVKSKITTLPGDTILISGIVNEAFGNNVLKASAEIVLDNNSNSIKAVDGKFELNLQLAKNIKSGKHPIGISTQDSKNNAGSASIELDVTAIPTYVKTETSAAQLPPGSKIEIISSLYDQADDLMNASLELSLDAPSSNNAFKKTAQSNEKISYEFSQYAEPGLYTLTSTYKNLFTHTSINITPIREVKIKYGNETVLIENIGNIPFEDELTFFLESKLKKYPITKKIKIEPGKTLDIDLSKEVPLGVYNVLLQIKEGIEPVKEKIQDVVESARESIAGTVAKKEDVLADDVTIHDNRPAYKKITGGLSSMQAKIVGADGLLAKNPLIAPIALVVILSLIVFRYARKPIMRLIKRKKDDENKEQEN